VTLKGISPTISAENLNKNATGAAGITIAE
jgi:hypothetical protein